MNVNRSGANVPVHPAVAIPTLAWNKLIDWKETFSSFDYDNPWSAYIPLPTTTTTEKAFEQNHVNTSKRGRVVESIINNTWHRRRHGMNLGLLDAAHDYVIIGKVRAQASTVGQYCSADIANPENVGLVLNTIK
jgi:hypothetical protein